jgi:hypothetical protein
LVALAYVKVQNRRRLRAARQIEEEGTRPLQDEMERQRLSDGD